ncbi:hypothetical protein [Paenibacillus xylanexedens]|uniref:hypothetical protein n=1 Tax=Paenibacillus xylanexedens TaxID=528191 RepID=UPI0011A2D427|nr:hypothetical protein [Paenibacillus xylanexedens]
MKIKAKVKIRLGRDLNYEVDSLKLKVTFKSPNKFRKVELCDYIVARKWREKETKKDFLERCNVFLSNKDEVVFVVKEMVIEYFKKKEIAIGANVLEDKLMSSVKAFNKNDFEIEVEI